MTKTFIIAPTRLPSGRLLWDLWRLVTRSVVSPRFA